MALLLLSRLILEDCVGETYLKVAITKIMRYLDGSFKDENLIFDFILIIWQRKRICIMPSTI
jgi:hypothetical protein